MSIIIKDGEGGCNSAGVTTNNRLKTTGVDLSLTEAATETGDTYNINTGELTLTSSGKSVLLYLKNNEATNLIIDNIIVNIKDYVGTDGQPEISIERNATAGTILSSATPALISNRNFGSNKSLSATYYQGAEGVTSSSMDSDIAVYLPSTAVATINVFDTITVLPRGAAISIAYTPPAGITSMKVIIALNVTLNGTQL